MDMTQSLESLLQRFEPLLQRFSWSRGGPVDQFLDNDDVAQPEFIFYNPSFTSSVFALNSVIDRRRPVPEYAPWAFYEEGALSDWGSGEKDLLELLKKLARRRGSNSGKFVM